jgi:hypothetical protein
LRSQATATTARAARQKPAQTNLRGVFIAGAA